MKRLLFILILVITNNLYAYFAMNQRNHSELKWKSIESDHIEVVYHDPLIETAEEALVISEATYAALVKTYGIELDHKIQIFVTNQDKITNGYSMAGKYVAIWVDVNDYVSIFTGREKWLRKVLSHELSHHFVFESIRSWVDLFLPVSALTFPSDFNEGYAMFFSGEEWGYGREDANLRKGVFSNDLSYQYPDGFFYTTGFSMVRYLYEFYGLEKLQELLKYRNKAKIYSFKSAFKKVYGKSLKDFKEEWRRYVYTYYFGNAYAMKSNIQDTSDFQSVNKIDAIKTKGWNNFTNMSAKDSLVFFMGKGSSNQNYFDLGFGYFNQDTLNKGILDIKNIQKIENVSTVMDMAISNNLNYLAYVKFERGKYGSILPKIFLYEIAGKKKIRTVTGRLAQVDNQGGIYYQQLDHENNYVKYYFDGVEKSVLTFDKKMALGQLRLSPDGRHLAMSQFDEESRFLLVVYSTVDFSLLKKVELETFPRNAFWKDNSNILLTLPGAKESRTLIQNYNLETGVWTLYNTPPYNVIAHRIEKTDSTAKFIVEGELGRLKKSLLKIEMCDSADFHYEPNINYYSRWIHAKYPHEILLPDTVPDYKKQKYSHLKNLDPFINFVLPDDKSVMWMSYWMDPLMKHDIAFVGFLEYQDLEPYFAVNYGNRMFRPVVNLSYMKYVWLGGIWDETWFFQDVQNLALDFSFPLDWIKSPFCSLRFSSGLMYQNVARQKKSVVSDTLFEDGSALTSETGIRFLFNLPYKNSFVHPVRKVGLNYHLSMANSKLGMQKDFVEHELNFELAFAPLYDSFKMKTDFLLFTNQTHCNLINGKYFSQYQPGLDINENIPVSGGLITERQYVRGFEVTLTGERLLITKNELWVKISDDMKLSLNFGGPLVSLSYLGLGVFSDYGMIWYNDKSEDFRSFGYESKALINILGIPTVQRFGRAYNADRKEYHYYYQMNIPVDLEL
ncbi:MAG: hypothetical protein JXQ65_08430 [Candidatus Marinimicrobia bacterium]|nr:hypothetical protein [Candidatus Neomarinimicrobiota bacterium]